jgi:crotonobetainyl-CoA:carnitine CoA-transferase CaiB-like acyl-CoA transferase
VLGPYRVLDLTNHRGLLCGQVLADLGADVIQIEPPGGSPARRLGPFAGDVVDPERSLFWWAYARNKRGATLDVSGLEGRALFLELVRKADFVIESERPGTLAAWGLGHDTLATANPRIVTVSISAFGQTGPKAGWAESDIVLLAAGGPLFLQGDDDRAPVRLPVPQAYLHAGAEGAVAALVAHHERERSGRGQHVDVSAQQALALATQSYILCDAVGSPQVRRVAGGLKNGPLTLQLLFPAKDGHVAITFLFGSAIGRFSERLMRWIHAEGGCDVATRDKDWIGYTQLLLSGREPLAEFERVKRVVADFTRTRTKADLLAAALANDLLIAPVATIDEVVDSPQLAVRDYWRSLPHADLDREVRYPGPFARFGGTPLAAGRRAPAIGEHNREVFGDLLGLDAETVAHLAATGVIA